MKLKLTRHFQDMMFYRGINVEHVKEAINSPDFKKFKFEDRILVRKKIGIKNIEVVYCKDGFKDRAEEYIVITAYYL